MKTKSKFFVTILVLLISTAGLFAAVPAISADHIYVGITNWGTTGSTAIIGTQVTVTLVDPDYGGPDQITAATANLTSLGGAGTFVMSGSIGIWTYTYTVIAGGIDTVNQTVSVIAYNTSGNTYMLDNALLTVDNILPVIVTVGTLYLADDDSELSGATIADISNGASDQVTYFAGTVSSDDGETWLISTTEFDANFFTVSLSGSTNTLIAGSLNNVIWNPELKVTDDAGNFVLDNISSATDATTPFTIDNVNPSPDAWGSLFLIYDDDGNGIADFNASNPDTVRYVQGTYNAVFTDIAEWRIQTSEFFGNFIATDFGPAGPPVDLLGYDDRQLVQGSLDGVYWTPDVTIYDDVGNNATSQIASSFLIDNSPPTIPLPDVNNWAYFQVGGVVPDVIGATAGIGDVATAIFNFGAAGINVWTGTFDFSPIGGGIAVPGLKAVVGGDSIIYASYTIEEGDVTGGYIADLAIDVTLVDYSSNSATTPSGIEDTSTGDDFAVDGEYPDLTGAADIDDTGYLRFSPVSTVVGSYWDTPDVLEMDLTIPDWGLPGEASSFVIRINIPDTDALIGDITYTSTDIISAVGDVITFAWDGEYLGTPQAESVYGFTLVSIQDDGGNEAIVGQAPIGVAVIADGITAINKVQAVLDNTPPIFVPNINQTVAGISIHNIAYGSETDTINRFVNDVDNDDTESAGDIMTSSDVVYFQFGLDRWFVENTAIERHEFVKYWVTVESAVSGYTSPHYFQGSFGDQGSTSFDQDTDPTDVDYTINYSEAFSSVGETGSFQWNPLTGSYPFLFPEGDYTVTAFIQDNSGNIETSGPKPISIVNEYFTAPEITAILITSEHDGGTSELAPYAGDGDHNFYVDSYYDAPPNELYYDTDDIVTFDITVADIANVDSLTIDASALDLGLLTSLPGDFVGNVLTVSWDVTSDFGEDDAALDPGVEYQIGVGNLTVLVYGADVVGVPSVDTDEFNLIIPPEPLWPVIDPTITTAPQFISPGDPLWAYNSSSNPANDGNDEESLIGFEIAEANTDYTWTLTVSNPLNSLVYTQTGDVSSPWAAITEGPFIFTGLDDAYALMIPAKETATLDVDLALVIDGFGDTGYLAPPSTTAFTNIYVDNTNPGILNEDGSPLIEWDMDGDGTPDPAYAGHLNIAEIAVSAGDPTFSFTITTTEPLLASFGADDLLELWSVGICDIDGNDIVGTDPSDAVVTATITGINPIGALSTVNGWEGYTEFEFYIALSGLSTLDEDLDAILVLRALDADGGENPNRTNSPPYPFDADTYYEDSSEAFVKLMILKNEPVITDMSFLYNVSTTHVGDPAITGVTTFDFGVTFTGYPGLMPELGDFVDEITYSADFSAFTGIDTIGTLNTTGVTTGIGPHTAVWEGVTFTGFADLGLVSGDAIGIPVTIELGFDPVAGHEYSISETRMIFVDFTDPTIVIQAPVADAVDMIEGTTYTVRVDYDDAHSGVNLDTATLVCNTDPLIVPVLTYTAPPLSPGDNLTGSWMHSSPSTFIAGTTMDLELEVYNGSDDVEWISDVYVQFPLGVTVNAATNIIGGTYYYELTYDGATGDGASIHWFDNDGGYGNILNGESAFTTVNITIDPAFAGDIVLNYQYDGDIWGSEPHTITGSTYLTQEYYTLWEVTILADYPTRILDFTATIEDKVANENSDTVTWDIGPIPLLTALDITNNTVPAVPYWLKSGQEANLTFDLTDSERIDSLDISLNTDFYYGTITYLAGEILTIPDTELDEDANSIILEAVNSNSLPHLAEVIATVTIYHEYDHSLDFTTEVSDGALQIDIVEPVISAITFDQDLYPVILITANVIDPEAEVDIGDIYLDLTTIDINFNGNPDTYVEGLATWSIDVTGLTPHTEVNDGIITVTATDKVGNGEASLTKQVDTQPTVSSLLFYVNGEVSDVIPLDNSTSEVTIEAVITAITDHLDPWDIDLSIDYMAIDITVPDPTLIGTPVDNLDGTSTYTYGWDESAIDYVAIAALEFLAGYEVIPFQLYVESRYGFEADPYPYNRDIIVLDNYEVAIYGEVPEMDYSGIDPDGWFAPEHNVISEYLVMSTLPVINIKADFDYIIDNVPEIWTLPDNVTITDEGIWVHIGSDSTLVTIYTHFAEWDIIPDFQSVWNAYEDGELVPIDFQYDDPFSTGLLASLEEIQVDLEVPKYMDTYGIGNMTTYSELSMSTIAPLDYEVEFALSVDPGDLSITWLEGAIYLETYIEDYFGVGFDTLATTIPTVPAGWSIAIHSYPTVDKAIWEITADDSFAVNDGSSLVVQLEKVEDLVGHYNYAVGGNSTSSRYEEVGPTITMHFVAEYNDVNIEFLQVFQIDDAAGNYGEYTDTTTSPYLRAEGRVGIALELTDNFSDDVTITVEHLYVLEDYFQGDADDTWVELAYNGTEGVYYLDGTLFVDASIPEGPLPFKYKINYRIDYTDPTRPSTYQEYISGDVDGYIIIDNTSPEFVFNGIHIWSETLGYSEEGYVNPGDTLGVLEITFDDVSGFDDPLTKPTVEIEDLYKFADIVSSGYTVYGFDNIAIVDPADIVYTGGHWVATLDSLHITLHLDGDEITSQLITVTLTDVVGNDPTVADRFVEITGDGPIFPVIRRAELFTELPEGDILTNYISHGVPAEVKVYITCEYEAFIEEIWIDAIPGVTIGAAVIDTTSLYYCQWVATFPVIADDTINSETVLDFTVHTKRNPFGAIPVFNDELSWEVVVDGISFDIDNVEIYANPYDVDGIINPDEESFTVEADFTLVNEIYGLNIDSWDLNDWFVLENGSLTVLDSYTNAPIITGTGTDRHAVWTVLATELDVGVASMVAADLNINYRNIYGHTKDHIIEFDIDNEEPVPDFEAVVYGYPPTDLIDDTDWTSIRIPIADPDIVEGVVDGSGLRDATMEIVARPETPVDPAVLADLNAGFVLDLVDGYVELSFTTYSAHNLAEGYYDINITTEDFVVNTGEFTEPLFYTWAPAEIMVFVDELQDYAFNTSDDDVHLLRALVSDPLSMVNHVDFKLYFDTDNSGEYEFENDADWTGDLFSVEGLPDYTVPYEAVWDVLADNPDMLERYNYTDTLAAHYGLDATRRWFLRAEVTSNAADAVTDTIISVMVTDNIAPVPEDVTIPDPIYYDYYVPSLNVATFTADCGLWPDADYIEFVITGDGYTETLIGDLPTNPVGQTASVDWDYDGEVVPGDFTLDVIAYDYVGNASEADSYDFTIGTYASQIYYGLTLWNFDVPNWDDATLISDGEEFGPDNPITDLYNLRIDAEFNNLDGAASIGFWYTKIDNATGDTLGVYPVTNNTIINPDFPEDASYIPIAQISGTTVRIVPTEDIYTNGGNYDGTDYIYEFFVVITDEHLGALPPHVNSHDAWMQVDYLAPTVVFNEGTEFVTWSQGNIYEFGYIDDDLDTTSPYLEWSFDGADAWIEAIVGVNVNGIDSTIVYTNWETEGGSIAAYVGGSFEGDVYLRATIEDNVGNVTVVDIVDPVYVDNQAPSVPITEVAYGDFNSPTSTLHELVGNEIEIIYNPLIDPQGSQLKMRVHQDDVDPLDLLSTTAIGEEWDDIPAWITDPVTDLSSPLMLYHGYSADEGPEGIMWDEGLLYDHEADEYGYYGFDILYQGLDVEEGYHYYAFVANDFRGNLEGDAVADSNGIAFDGTLTDEELTAMYDLKVYIYSDEVVTDIISHGTGDIVGEYLNLAGDITKGDEYVDEVRFEYYADGSWQEISTTPPVEDPVIYMHLYRDELPGYDDLSFVPGIHLYNGSVELVELTWNGVDAWEDEIILSAAATYDDIKFAADLNDNGVIDGNELAEAFVHPNGFEEIITSPYMAYLNTELLIDGIYSFRVVALDEFGVVLYDILAEITDLHIDNTAPTAVMNTITSVEIIQPGSTLHMITDVDGLLVADEDIIRVEYQYSGQDTVDINGIPTQNRQWISLGGSDEISGEYLVDWDVADPINDGIDNDGDGFIDEDDEEDAMYFLRSYAYDVAGNYGISEEYILNVDGSFAEMEITYINGDLAANYYIVDSSEELLTIRAFDITPFDFDLAVTALFEYRAVTEPASEWIEIDDVATTVDYTEVTLDASGLTEGYYEFKVTATDEIGNTDDDPGIVTIIYDDVTAPELTFLSVDGIDLVSDLYVFAQSTTDNNLIVGLAEVLDVATVTFEYSVDDVNWVNINSVAVTPPDNGMFEVESGEWTLPAGFDHIYLRALGEDYQGNDNYTALAELYLDNEAPAVSVIVSPLETYEDNLTMNVENDSILFNMTYVNDALHPAINDIAYIEGRIYDSEGDITKFATSTGVDGIVDLLTFLEVHFDEISDGIYGVEVTAVDFAGNSTTITPEEYEALYLDRTAPAELVLTSSSHPNWVAVYDETIDFELSYYELIGVDIADPISVQIVYDEATTVIDTVMTDISVDNVEGIVGFSWTPSEEMQQYLINGLESIPLSISIDIVDYLDHTGNLMILEPLFMTLQYGVPLATQMLVVEDEVLEETVSHYVNWNASPPEIDELIGGNEATIFAYIPHLAVLPIGVEFFYKGPGDVDFISFDEGDFSTPDNWTYIDFMQIYQAEVSGVWDTDDRVDGSYEIKAISYYDAGTSESIILLDLYRDMIIPVYSVKDTVGVILDTVERGESYDISIDSFDALLYPEIAVDMVHLVRYSYRFVDESQNPISGWMYFGDEEGTAIPDWIEAPFTLNWTVYPYYLFNEYIQIVIETEDIYGTTRTLQEFIANGGTTPIIHLEDNTGPEIFSITIPESITGPDVWISGETNVSVEAEIHTNVYPNDIDYVEFYHNSVLIGTDAEFTTGAIVTAGPFDFVVAVESGIEEILVKAYDIHENMSERLQLVGVDNDLPVITDIGYTIVYPEYITEGTIIQITADLSDAHSGLLAEDIFLEGYGITGSIAADSFDGVLAIWDELIEVPTNMNFITYTVNATDRVGLAAVPFTKSFDIGAVPTIVSTEIDNSTIGINDYMKDGDDLHVSLVLTDWERVDEVVITLNSDPVQSHTFTVITEELAHLFENVISTDVTVVASVVGGTVYHEETVTFESSDDILVDNDVPLGDMIVEKAGVEVTNLEREEVVLLNAQASDLLSGMNTVTYDYRMVDGEWIAITAIDVAPYTYEWEIPADLEYGAYYEFRATVTDIVLNTEEYVSNAYEVTDENTIITIVSVAGILPVNGQIPNRITGDIEIVTSVEGEEEQNGQNIPNIEYLVKTVESTDWRELDPLGIGGTTLTVNVDELASGEYHIGVAPHEALSENGALPVDFVLVTIDNDFEIEIISALPDTDGMFNGDQYLVEFSVVTDDEVDETSFMLEYRSDVNPEWIDLNIASAFIFNGDVYNVDLTDLDGIVPDGRYDFRFSVRDLAIVDGNVAEAIFTNVLYDTGVPEVNFVEVNEVTDFTDQVDIMIGQEVDVLAEAYDALGGQIYLEASGVERVVFSYSVQQGESFIIIGEDFEEPYETVWNTSGYLIDSYLLRATVYDNVGNESYEDILINMIPFAEPFAIISGFDFDEEYANVDKIFAVTKDCIDNLTDHVRFEFSLNGIDWEQFAETYEPIVTENEVDLWAADFNADNMGIPGNTIMLRAVAVKLNGVDTDVMPELTTTYSDDMGGMFILPTNEDAVIYYNDVVHIDQVVETVPFVTAMNEVLDASQVTVVELLEPIVNVGDPTNFTADVSIVVEPANAYGRNIDVWSVYLDDNEVQLEKATLRSYTLSAGSGSNGTMTSEDDTMTLNVPLDGGEGAIYFEPVHVDDELPILDYYFALSGQEAIMGSLGSAEETIASSDFTIALTGIVDDGDIFVTVNNEIQTDVDVVIEDDIALFSMVLQTGIYSIIQSVNVNLENEFVWADPEYINGTELWTMGGEGNDPIDFNFRAYTLYDPATGTYVVPSTDYLDISIFIDGIEIVHEDISFDDQFVTFYDIDDITGIYGVTILDGEILPEGLHVITSIVTMNGYSAIVEQSFYVDVNAPVISNPSVGQITAINRTVEATIIDLQTDLFDVELHFNSSYCDDLVINYENLIVTGDVISYEITMDELFTLGYDDGDVGEITVRWDAVNNVTLYNSLDVDYTVNLDGPAITFTGFENGWWLNPTNNTDLTFTVEVDEGNTMPHDGVWIELYEITNHCSSYPFQIMELDYINVNGNIYDYSVGFGQLLSPEATGVRLLVYAENNYAISTISEQTYSFDYSAPVVWAISPIGDGIDNDGDGLTNEDPINGINEDQDWVDENHNGIWDWVDLNGNGRFDPGEGELPIIDEDPLDFVADSLAYGTDIVIAVGFEDVPGFIKLTNQGGFGHQWYYTGASGIDAASVAVTLNGDPIEGEVTNGSFVHDAGNELYPGHYVVVATIADYVGNVGSVSYEFEIAGPAPTVQFIEPDAGWWLNAQNANTLSFTVDTFPEMTLAFDGVVANVYCEPDNIVIQGPITLSPNEDGIYEVVLNAGIVPTDQTAVRLQVFATNIWSNTSESNQSYGLDTQSPEITFVTPEDGEEFTINEVVNVLATFTDIVDTDDRNVGSGIMSAELTVTDPSGVSTVVTTVEDILSIELLVDNLAYGTYNVNLIVTDKVGNVSVEAITFVVITPLPTVIFNELNGGWWFNPAMNEAFTFTVTNPVEIDEVVVTFYGVPSGDILQGPQTLEPVSGTDYEVFLGATIPEECAGVTLEVVATNIYGATSTNSQAYSVDIQSPEITFVTPENGEEFNIAEVVSVLANFTDNISETDRNVGSGILSAVLTVTDPSGVPTVVTTGEDSQSIELLVEDLEYGTYNVNLVVTDKVGNVSAEAITFVVITPVPTVTFNELNGGWWFSPAMNEAFTFTVTNPVEIDEVVVTFYAVPSGDVLQGPQTLEPVSGNDYEVFLGATIPEECAGVTLEVVATNVYGATSTNSQAYSVDIQSPEITFVTPEDGEEFNIVEVVSVLVTFTDNISETDRNVGSGILSAVLTITDPSGEPTVVTTGEDVLLINTNVNDLAYGTYNVNLVVTDKVGNVSAEAITFVVIAPAPTAQFIEPNAGWWLNAQNANTLSFTVATIPEGTLAFDGVVANIYCEPDNMVIQGPTTVSPNEDGIYEIVLNAGIIPEGQTAVRLQVFATNIWGNTSESNQSYGIDTLSPVITFVSPEDGEEFNIGEVVSVLANFTDNVIARDRNAGSGIMSAELKITDPSGEFTIITTGEDVLSINTNVSDLQYGLYDIMLTVMDKVGNQAIETLSFNINAPAPSVNILGISSEMYTFGNIYNPGHTLVFDAEIVEVPSVEITDISLNIYRTYLEEGQLAEQLVEGDVAFVETITGITYSSIPTNLDGDIGLRYELSVIDEFGSNVTVSQSYTIDDLAPLLTIISPEIGYEVDLGGDEQVNVEIKATFEDAVAGINLSGLELIIDGVIISNDDPLIAITANMMTYNGYFGAGNHTIKLTAVDNVSNEEVIIWTFTVNEEIILVDAVLTSAHFYPNPVQAGNSGTFAMVWANSGLRNLNTANISIQIFDFSGKLVRTLNGTSDNAIAWDCKTNDGTKLARGAYFARITVNNGHQDYIKIVKVAIQ
ncbi:MAG: T9SS type A sorting domain-containing protein [Candidatus Tenebribacter burtonii]|nr:T9SS type A sorting domain-containing protein [Candidatus Tenebribacter burtonii]